MAAREPQTQSMSTSDAGREFAILVRKVSAQEARVVVEENGKPVAAIISAHDLRRLAQLEMGRSKAFQALEATQALFQDVPDDELEREVTRALEAVRAQKRLSSEQR